MHGYNSAMPYRTITAENAAAALGAAVACARDLADGGAVPAVLVPSLPAVARLRRALADGGRLRAGCDGLGGCEFMLLGTPE